MRNLLLRSSLVGFCFGIINWLVGFIALYLLMESGSIRLGPNGFTLIGLLYLVPYALVYTYQITFCGFPFLFLIVAIITWLVTRNVVRKSSMQDGKNQVMVAVWLSLIIAISPFILAALIDFVGTLIANGLNGSRGSKYELVASLLLFLESMVLIFLMGLLARLSMRKNRNLKIPAVEEVQ